MKIDIIRIDINREEGKFTVTTFTPSLFHRIKFALSFIPFKRTKYVLNLKNETKKTNHQEEQDNLLKKQLQKVMENLEDEKR